MCRKMYSSPMCQKMANLPPERCLPDHPPFTNTGVDLFGPLHVKLGRSDVKRYGCVYTCFTTRAIHLEVLNSLEADSFINGFLRFISRRGRPSKIWSDNGTNLVGAQSELSRGLRQLDRKSVIAAARQKMVEWSFNPPLASHQGGVWERQIRTIRRILVALINTSARMSDEILHTTLCCVEAIVNSRPITKCSSDICDDSPLSPNHLLLMKSDSTLPWGDCHDGDTYRKRWRQVQHLSDQFWRRWLKEYLPELQKRHKWQQVLYDLKVGDLVLVMDEGSPRGAWPLGLVTATNRGRDGLVRSAKIKTKSTVMTRPITKLVLLEEACYRPVKMILCTVCSDDTQCR